MPKPNKPQHLSVRREISRTVSATKNLRAISRALVEKVRANDGVSPTQVANQLSAEAVSDITATVADVSAEEIAAIERNIRRRLYDSLKVLVSIGAIRRSPRDKSLSWIGVHHLIPQPSPPPPSTPPPPTITTDPTPVRLAIALLRQRLIAKTHELSQIRAHFNALHTLFQRNESNPAPPQHRLDFPFVVIRTHPTTHIRLHSTPARDNLNFTFEGAYELVNDSGILDRLFVVGNGPPLQKLISRPANPTPPTAHQPPLTHNANQPTPHDHTPAPPLQYTSPLRQPVGPTVFHFAKFTSGRTPALSPALSTHTAQKDTHSTTTLPPPAQSPLLTDCVRLLGGGDPLRAGASANDGCQALEVGSSPAPVMSNPPATSADVGQAAWQSIAGDFGADCLFGNPNLGSRRVEALLGLDFAGGGPWCG